MKVIAPLICVSILAGALGCQRSPNTDDKSVSSTSQVASATTKVAGPVINDKKNRKLNFTISKETTYVTGPIDNDGYIDYVAALNERLGKGITPETNANVLIWKAIGPTPEGERMPAQFFKLMGMEEPPATGNYLVDSRQFLHEQFKIKDPGALSKIDRQFTQTTQYPWSADDYPETAAWLKANAQPLDLVVEATKRSRYFAPLAPPNADTDPSRMVSASLARTGHVRNLANALATRAMSKLNAGKHDECWKDLLACHRLARLIGQRPTGIEGVIAIAVESISQRADLAFLERAEIDSKQLLKCLKDLKELPPLAKAADQIDLGERLSFFGRRLVIEQSGNQGL